MPAISTITATTCVGAGMDALASALLAERSGLSSAGRMDDVELPGWVGRVDGLDAIQIPSDLRAFDCRNHRLAWLGLNQDGFLDQARSVVEKYGRHRVGVFMGTSTSGIAATEQAYRDVAEAQFSQLPAWYDFRHTHNVHAITEFVAFAIGAQGINQTISTACSSSAKVFACADRALRAGVCDAVIVGGVDSLCLTTLCGFNALQLVAPHACRPADANRLGISIGEAAGFAIIESNQDARWQLLGYGESSDAYHMSTPDPKGHGAQLAMRAALAKAGLETGAVDYINLHGTGTRSNDASEDAAVYSVFGAQTPCSSTKAWTGHCLGAAGIVEAAIAIQCLELGLVPASLNTEVLDPELRADVQMHSSRRPVQHVMSNSFGFGGTNCSLLFGATA